MTSEEIQRTDDREKLYVRVVEKDVRKTERRLLRRKINRIEAESNSLKKRKENYERLFDKS
ncbi:MAG: hypothetical protein RDU14_17020 [Melioribacteraceae bacterium]|nr:hypothetical protein [Melioribacteraceae bacterium]